MEPVLWTAGFVIAAVGVAGTFLPALPGPLLVLLGLGLAAAADGFERVGPWTLLLLALLTGLAYAVDLAAGALGARRFGATPRAAWGAAAGALVGLFFGLPGLILGPFVGAVAGELTARRRLAEAGRAGAGAWLGMILGGAVKVGIVVAMLALFAAALWL